jgi:carbonic anhydrase
VRKLLQGIAEFRRTRRADYAETFARLALGQTPDAMLIACSDSRVVPNLFASAEPGDLFVVRNLGNLVPPSNRAEPTSGNSVPAAIEFALATLRVKDIVVCGHSECAAVRAILDRSVSASTPNLAAWLRHGDSARDGLGLAPFGISPHDHLSQRSVLRQVENLKTYPQVREAIVEHRLRLHAWWFDIARAEVLDHDEATDRFVPLDEARVAKRLAEIP